MKNNLEQPAPNTISRHTNNKKLLKIKKVSHVAKLFQKVTLDDIKDTYRHLPFNNICIGDGGGAQKGSSHISTVPPARIGRNGALVGNLG